MPNKKHRLNEIFDKVIKDLEGATNTAMLDLQEGMQGWISDSIDLSSLLKMVEGMGLPNIMSIARGNIPGFDPYKVLGLEKTATDEEVKQRYRSLMFKLHPDTSGVRGTEFIVQMITMAYEMIEKERGWS